MKRTKELKIEWSGKITGLEYSNRLFDELVVRKAVINDVTFKNVHFKNSYLGFNTQYFSCQFVDCKFYGKYSSLGSPAIYTDCKFEHCEFNGTSLFNGQHFYNCVFSGILKNPILYDKHPQIENNETVFKNCDLANLLFDNVNIYGKDIFENCILPKSGIRLFDNAGNKLIQRAEDICRKINSEDALASEIIFKRELKKGQNPIILDNLFLKSFLKTEHANNIFYKIIKDFEIDRSI